MIVVTLEPEKPFTNAKIKKLAKENNLKVKTEIRKGKQYIYFYIDEKENDKTLQR